MCASFDAFVVCEHVVAHTLQAVPKFDFFLGWVRVRVSQNFLILDPLGDKFPFI